MAQRVFPKVKMCRAYFDGARSRRDNPLISGYLLGLSHAWRLAGDIDRQTFEAMNKEAKTIYEEDRP